MRKALRLVERMKDCSRKGSANLRQSIVTLAESIVEVLIAVGIEEREEWVSTLTEFIKEGVESVRALEFAKRYISRRKVCELVFELGEDYYGVLH